MLYIELLKHIWDSVYNPSMDVVEIIEKFFHPDYEQCINGVKMNRTQYIQHVLEQRKSMTVDSIEYQHVIILREEIKMIIRSSQKSLPIFVLNINKSLEYMDKFV